MKNCCNSQHPDHSEEFGRLNRLIGQLEGIKKMIKDRRYCPDVIIQLRAVYAAIKAVEINILHRHLKACVKESFQKKDEVSQKEKIDELITLFKKLD